MITSVFLLCGANNGTAIPTIPKVTCENFGKAQMFLMQRIRKVDGTLNSMTLADAKLLATWTPLLTEEVLGTKVQATPYTESPSFTDGSQNEDRNNLGLYMVSDDGKLMVNTDDSANPTTVYPIPIQSFAVGNKVAGGYDDVDYNTLGFQLLNNWSDNVIVIQRSELDFDPLTALLPV